MDEREKFQNCYNKLMDSFTTYDQNVDVVSCWESIINYGYREEHIFFDRYPCFGENNLTPDFTVLFNEEYGIIFEIKRTFPNDEQGFKSVVKQLMSYDTKSEMRADPNGTMITPKCHDIVIVVGMMDSYEILARFNDLVNNDDEINFNILIRMYNLELLSH